MRRLVYASRRRPPLPARRLCRSMPSLRAACIAATFAHGSFASGHVSPAAARSLDTSLQVSAAGEVMQAVPASTSVLPRSVVRRESSPDQSPPPPRRTAAVAATAATVAAAANTSAGSIHTATIRPHVAGAAQQHSGTPIAQIWNHSASQEIIGSASKKMAVGSVRLLCVVTTMFMVLVAILACLVGSPKQWYLKKQRPQRPLGVAGEEGARSFVVPRWAGTAGCSASAKPPEGPDHRSTGRL